MLLCVGVGFSLSGQAVTNVLALAKSEYETIETFTNILAIVRKNYVDNVKTKDLILGAIEGMLNSHQRKSGRGIRGQPASGVFRGAIS